MDFVLKNNPFAFTGLAILSTARRESLRAILVAVLSIAFGSAPVSAQTRADDELRSHLDSLKRKIDDIRSPIANREQLALEMADVLAWLVTLANIRGIDLEAAVRRKYGTSCPGCQAVPCVCDPAEKP